MSSIRKISGVVLVGMALALAGCGNDDSTTSGGLGGGSGTSGGGTGNGTGTGGTTGSSTSTAHTIVLTYPYLDRIENLGGGVYRSLGKAIVTDSEGNAVPDGTVISFNLIDSVIARGTITTADGDGITGSVLTDAGPTKGNGVTATNFVDAYVERNAAHRFIQSGDHVFLTDKADAEDKNRVVSSDTGAITSSALTMTSAYGASYPNAVYGSGNTKYVVGASLLGAEVSGLDADGNLRSGYAATKEGIATFYVTYPANVGTIHTGCGIENIDERALPIGSANVYLVASAANDVTTVDDRFCFGSIAGWTITPDFSGISGTKGITMVVEDGGDQVNLPYVSVVGNVVITTNVGGMTVTLDNTQGYGAGIYLTDRYGYVSSTITVGGTPASGDAATITYRSGDAITTVELKIP